METTYRLNADELDGKFVDSLKSIFKNKEIEIVVSEVDETEYLFRSSKNKEVITDAINDIENNQNIVIPDQSQFQ